MFEYRQALVRLRAGDTVREIARSGLMGRDKLAIVRTLALQHGWLDPSVELPDDATIAAALGPPRRASSTVSSVEPLRTVVQHWFNTGVQGRAIHAALVREHGYSGNYSAVVRMLRRLRAEAPPEVTVRLFFAPGEAAQVDFGAGPMLCHPDGRWRRTWAFVMTLCHSRHQYVEFVWDQSSATWLGCHRRAFEWFDGVPAHQARSAASGAVSAACRPRLACRASPAGAVSSRGNATVITTVTEREVDHTLHQTAVAPLAVARRYGRDLGSINGAQSPPWPNPGTEGEGKLLTGKARRASTG